MADAMFLKNNMLHQSAETRAIEWFAGLGGFSTAWPELEEVTAIDIDRQAAIVYSANHAHPYWIREIESLPVEALQRVDANLWWMSPPCQPYSYRGRRRDLEDGRSRSFLRVIEFIAECLPECVVLENVVGFADSQAHDRFIEQLAKCGYSMQSITLCPTQMQWPNRRPRFYLMATRGRALLDWQPLPQYEVQLGTLIESIEEEQCVAPELIVGTEELARIESSIDRCVIGSERPTACFGSSYGRALLGSGSYLQLSGGQYRRFTPHEVAGLLGFPKQFQFPEQLSHRSLWKLLGNSLSLPAVRYVLSHLPDGPSSVLPWFSQATR